MRLGLIGTGNLASFFVEGLARAGAGVAITVSPRNAARARDLAARYGVAVGRDNQQVVDAADLVVVSVLPQDAEAVLAGLRFRPDQTVLSAMAGVSLAAMQRLAAPAAAMMPGLANAYGCGPSVLHPANAMAERFLAGLGPVHVYASEPEFVTASVMGAFSGMSVLMMRDAMDWFGRNGLAEAEARRLVAEILKGNATMLLASERAMAEVARGVVTPGGITEQGRRLLDAGGSWGAALDSVRQRLTGDR